jgi:hypothetical protein
MSNSRIGIKTIIIFIVIISIAFQRLVTGLDIDSNTIISQIAFLLFISVVGYYLFPQARERKRRIIKPKHKQYKESRLTDLIMEKIMNAYNVKEEETDEEVDEGQEEIDEDQEEATEEEVDEEQKEVTEEEILEDQEDETDEEVNEETEHRHYDDSRITDYVMKKIMKAYGIKEETEEESDEEVDEDQGDETDEGVNEETEHRRYANSSFTNYVMKRRIKAYSVKEESEGSDEAEEVEEVREKFENKPQIAICDGTEEENTGLIKALFSPVQLPLTLSGLWFIAIVIIYNFLPEIEQLIPSSIPSLAFTVLPILLLIGLSGFIGVLLEQFNENLEVTFKEKIISALNIFKILIGWGVGAFVFIKLLN